MNETQKEKLERFFDDTILADTVHGILLESFIGSNIAAGNNDVQVIAASRLAIDFFRNGWKELEKYKRKENSVQSLEKNVGL